MKVFHHVCLRVFKQSNDNTTIEEELLPSARFRAFSGLAKVAIFSRKKWLKPASHHEAGLMLLKKKDKYVQSICTTETKWGLQEWLVHNSKYNSCRRNRILFLYKKGLRDLENK